MKKKLTGKAIKRKPELQHVSRQFKIPKTSANVSVKSSSNVTGEGTSSQSRQGTKKKKIRQEKEHPPEVAKSSDKDEEGKKEETKKEEYKSDVWNDR
jgi:hypothetical protein